MSNESLTNANNLATKLIAGLEQIIKGRTDTIKLIITALLADGHVLLEDYPGSGKTTLAKNLGKLIEYDNVSVSDIAPFRRIQFTPDLLPGDVLGVTIFEPKTGQFRFNHGPVFAHVVLADEINRTGPKVQAAFLECMAEKQITIDTTTYPLDTLFFVLGTQNPLDVAGTYPLPQVQLDRFLFKIPMPYVDAHTEIQILEQHNEIVETASKLTPVCKRTEILNARSAIAHVHVHPAIRETIVSIVQATRTDALIQFGASTRAALMLQSALKSWAVVEGRDFVSEEDLTAVLPYVLLHRIKFHGGVGDAFSALKEIIAPHIEKLVSKKI